MNAIESLPETAHAVQSWKAGLRRAGLFALFLICGVAVFAFGVDYHTRFWTNTSGAFKVGLSALFLAAMLALRRSERGRAYWPVAFALFAASLTNVATWYLAGPLQRWLLGLVGVSLGTPQGIMWGKLVDVVLRLAPIFVLVWLVRDGLSSLFIRKGNLKWSLTLGFLALANLLATAIAVAASRGSDLTGVFASLPWWSAFALMNAFMEEVWYRGLFLERVRPHVGAAGAIWLTTLVFASSHLFATYVEPSEALIFGIITFTLGCAWALLMQKTNTLWGSVVFHMAADLYWLIGFGM
ncbi:MAG: CPBP family intramembrane metalloprotease [Anaerolineae bacterium]|nr:CPBP family intramembrane metalloprotease [Anaerolineae bacterium]